MASGVKAQDEARRAEARTHFQAGERHYEAREYALALTEFRAAYDLLEGFPNRPLILYNLGRCSDEARLDREAAEYYDRFLRDAPPDTPFRAEAEQHLREVRTRLSLRGESDPTVGGESISPVGPVVLGVGGAMLVAGAITGGLTLAADSDLAGVCSDGLCPDSARAQYDDMRTLAISTDVLLFGGAAVAAAGIILTIVLRDSTESTLTGGCGMDGCAIGVRGSF